MSDWKKKNSLQILQRQSSRENTDQDSEWLASQENCLAAQQHSTCLLRGFVFFGTECTDLQIYETAHYATSSTKKSVYLYFQQICYRHSAEPAHCFHAWLCALEAHPRRSYELSVAFFPHHWSKRNKTYSVWKPPHQTEIPHASICICLHMNHLVSNQTFLVSGIRFAYLHFTWGFRLWKAICRAESTQLFPIIWLYTMELSPGRCLFMAHHTTLLVWSHTDTASPGWGWAGTGPPSQNGQEKVLCAKAWIPNQAL